MSAASAAPPAQGNAPKKGKKLIIIVVALVLLLVAGGAAALFIMKKNMSAAEGDQTEEDGGHAAAPAKEVEKKAKAHDGAPPTFVPLEPFIVNLADRDTERFAQIGINLQVDDPKVGEEMKVYMPAIRNAVLLILSHKTAEDLLTAEGKIKLASEIQRGAARAMGYEIEEPEAEVVEEASADDTEAEPPKKKRKKKKVASYNPILQVHYANFIIQ